MVLVLGGIVTEASNVPPAQLVEDGSPEIVGTEAREHVVALVTSPCMVTAAPLPGTEVGVTAREVIFGLTVVVWGDASAEAGIPSTKRAVAPTKTNRLADRTFMIPRHRSPQLEGLP